MTRVYDILTDAIALVSHGWTQKAAARDASGKPCGADEEGAESWCLTGALYRHRDNSHFHKYLAAEMLVREAIGLLTREGTTTWNDSPARTQQEVLSALYRARIPKRKMFLPSDYHMPAVIGWLHPDTFEAEEPVDTSNGIFLSLKTTDDTPTVPPPRDV